MLRLHTIKAENGDCLILEFGKSDNKKFILIDGGPGKAYDKFLKPFLESLGNETEFELVVLSHIDNDHAVGLLYLIRELQAQARNNKPSLIKIKEFWHNSLKDYNESDYKIEVKPKKAATTRGSNEPRISELELKQIRKNIRTSFFEAMKDEEVFLESEIDSKVRGYDQGNQLRLSAAQEPLSIPINKRFENSLVNADHKNPTITIDNLTLDIIGPHIRQINRLMKEWKKSVKNNTENVKDEIKREIHRGDMDSSPPNLSSIMFLAKADGKSILFTGDGKYNHILKGLAKRGLLDNNKEINVDVLKLPHHGSERNVTEDFFLKVRAKHYVASGNDEYDNPHVNTLTMIAEAARDQKRDIIIHVTYNDTTQIRQFLARCPKKDFTYELKGLNPINDDEKFFTIDLS